MDTQTLGSKINEEPVAITIVMPYYNPGDRLRPTVVSVIEELKALRVPYEVIAVSDGSTDGSNVSVADLTEPSLVHLALPMRSGKGEALRNGFMKSSGYYIGFIDADGDIPPVHLKAFYHLITSQSADVVIGSKRHQDSAVVYPIARRFYSWGYQQLVRILFRLDVRDTQVGIKLFRGDLLKEALRSSQEAGFTFDLEILALVNDLGSSSIVEAPVTIGQRFSTTISAATTLRMLRDTLRVYWRLRLRRR